MAVMITIFTGLCSFIERPGDKRCEVYLPTGTALPVPPCTAMAMGHTATLTMPVTDIDILLTTWVPDFVVQHDAVQLGCWKLENEQVSFDTAPGKPAWNDRDKSVDFAKYHGKPAKSRADLLALGCSVMNLVSGSIQCGPLEAMQVLQGGVPTPQNQVAQDIRWLPGVATLMVTSSKGQIKVKNATTLNVSNVAPVPPYEGLKHFAFYYTVLADNAVKCPNRLSLEFAGVDVYDCVPPVPGS
jgi:hypothetical protein